MHTQIPKTPHKFYHWRWLVLNGRARRGISYPRRERIQVRNALKRIGLVYHEIVPFYNPKHEWSEQVGGVQWLDFVAFKGRMFAILFDVRYRTSNGPARANYALTDKLLWLESKEIPCLLVGRFHTAQEYEILIRGFMRRNL